MALLGQQLKGGSFQVEDYTFAGLAHQEELPAHGETGDERCVCVCACVCVCQLYRVSRYVLLVSGLGMGSSWCDQLSIEMLVDYVTSQLGGAVVSEPHTLMFANTVSLILASQTFSPFSIMNLIQYTVEHVSL